MMRGNKTRPLHGSVAAVIVVLVIVLVVVVVAVIVSIVATTASASFRDAGATIRSTLLVRIIKETRLEFLGRDARKLTGSQTDERRQII